MTNTEFDGWAALHCEATAAPPAVLAALGANRGIFRDEWRATLSELGECTHRMVTGFRVPKFAPEAAEAVAVELMALRKERSERAKPLRDDARPPDCGLCGDSGLVVVPHWRCVEVPHNDPPRLVPYRDHNVAYRSVVEVSVRCDRPGCLAGRRQADSDAKLDQAKRRMPLTNFLRNVGGNLAAGDVIDLLAAHNRAVAAEARRMADPRKEGFDFDTARDNILGRIVPTDDTEAA